MLRLGSRLTTMFTSIQGTTQNTKTKLIVVQHGDNFLYISKTLIKTTN